MTAANPLREPAGSMIGRIRPGWVVGALACVATHCTLTNRIDVCDRPRPAPHQINVRTEGDQLVATNRALAPMPDGRALLAFVSDVSASDVDDEVRVLRIDGAGQPAITCENEREFTLWPDLTHPQDGHPIAGVTLSAPEALADAGLLVWATYEPSDTSYAPEILALPYDGRSGCLFNGASRATLGGVPAGGRFTDLEVVGTGTDEFLVIWSQAAAGALAGQSFARAFHLSLGTPSWLPVQDVSGTPVTSAPAEVRFGPGSTPLFAVTTLGGGRIAIASLASLTLEPQLAVVDTAMRVLVAPFSIGAAAGMVSAIGLDVDVAFDGSQLLVVWSTADAAGHREVMGRLLTPEGDFLRGPLSHAAEPFVIPIADPDDHVLPSIAALPGGGFAVAWVREQPGAGSAPNRSIELGVITPAGDRAFLDPSCDRREVAASGALPGSHTRPSIVVLPDGSVLVAWSAIDAGGADVSGAAIYAVGMASRDLLPTR